MTVVTEEHSAIPAGSEAGAAAFSDSALPVDMGLLVTLNSRMHCRAPMQRMDPDATPLDQPVHVDGTNIVPVNGSLPASVETYRCACGFTIDVPAASMHALAS